ncbi:MAG: arylsulfotransferase family protein, partial [Cyclobacteriaceae bacterium]|nr:arylsulfotransferase family protein [Cyclobacteriaceae bacterium]
EILKHDDKYVAIFYDKKVFDLSLVGGNKEDIVNTDGIIVFDTLGRVVFKWSVFDVINPIEIDNVLIAKKDLGHANAVMVDRDGNYMISLRDFNQIWKINSANGELMWKLGENGDFPLPDSLEFIGQHSVELNKYGGFDVFDNGNKQIRPESRIINFILDEENKLIKKSKLIPLSLDLTSYRMCSAYQIDLNHYLVCTTRKQLLVSVVDLDGNVVWQISGNQASYRAYPVDWFVNDSFHSSK